MAILSFEDLSARLNALKVREMSTHDLRRAAVFIPFHISPDGVSVLLTRRSPALAKHPGEVSFPGGGMHEEDKSLASAALRETCEELGTSPDNLDLIGKFHEMHTITGFHITPYVGRIRSVENLEPNPMEVERAFLVPYAVVSDFSRWERQTYQHRGAMIQLWSLTYDDEFIWGATAFILRELLEFLAD